jgi:membrane protein
MSSTPQAPDVGDRALRGREAGRPGKIPAAGWKDVALRVKDGAARNHLSIVAAGVAFYLLLAFVPALAALVAVYGLFADPAEIGRRVATLGTVLPDEALALIQEQLRRLASTSSRTLSAGAAVGLLLSIWSATRGTRALIDGVNIAYEAQETRGWLRLTLTALGLTVSLIVFVVAALALVAVVPLVLDLLGLGGTARRAIALLRWPALLGMQIVALAVLYRYAPDRDEARWCWVSPGAILASAMWLLGSLAFSIYVSRSGGYGATYGSVGAIAVMMIWLLVGAFAVLLGAQLNAESERQTRRDRAEGAPRPMGGRGAGTAEAPGEPP